MNDSLNFPDEENEGGTLRWMSIVIAIVAIGGFFALAWYAYNAGTQTMTADTDISTVKADAAPLKETPEEPGGYQFPHQDKTVYDAISPTDSKDETVERIVPETEEPIAPVTADVSKPEDIAVKEPATESEQAEMISDTKDVNQENGVKVIEMAKPKEGSGPKRVELKPVSPIPMPPQESTEKAPEKTTTAEDDKPSSIREAIEKAQKEEAIKAEPAAAAPAVAEAPAKSEPKPVKAEPAKPAASASAGSDKNRVQLGAYRSESEAASSWKKINAKFASQLAGKKHVITRADLGAKGIFFRLQVMPFVDSVQAKSFCESLKGQGCLPVKVP